MDNTEVTITVSAQTDVELAAILTQLAEEMMAGSTDGEPLAFIPGECGDVLAGYDIVGKWGVMS